LHATYEMKTASPKVGTKGRTPFQVSVSVEPITPCVTSSPERTPAFRQLNFSERKTTKSTSKQGETTGGASSRSSIQISTSRGGSSSTQNMAVHDPTIKLLEFRERHLRTLKRTCSFTRRSEKKSISHMRIQNLCS
jgi:hypothetical protein